MWQLKPYRMWACKSGMARALIAASSVSKGTHSYSSESVAVSVADAEGVSVPTIVPEAPPPSEADLERLYAFVNDRFLPPPLILCRHCCDSLTCAFETLSRHLGLKYVILLNCAISKFI